MPQEIELTEVGSATPLRQDSQSAAREVQGATLENRETSRHQGFFAWLGLLKRTFGFKFLVILVGSQHMIKGFANTMCQTASLALFTSYGVRAQRMNIFTGTAMLPWSMKPIIGLVSDYFPIRNYHKGPYMVLSSIVGSLACLVLGITNNNVLPAEGAVLCLFLIACQFSACDLLSEARYAAMMQEHPELGPDLMTFVWFGLQASGLVATIIVGPIIEYIGMRAVYLFALPPLVLIVVPALKNYLEENPRNPEELAAARRKLLEQREAMALCVLMFVSTVVMTFLGIFWRSTYVNAAAALIVAVLLLVAFSVVLSPIIAKVNAFWLIQSSMAFSTAGATFYFMVDNEEQYKDGPKFSIEFVTSGLGIVGNVCSLFGIYLYKTYMKDWRYRRLIMVSNVTLSLLNLLDVVLLSRLNRKLGIPDHAFVLGSNAMQSTVQMWMWMPGVVLLSQLCPEGMEATMYALLAGCHNLGNNVAGNCGALVLELLDCTPSGQKHEDDKFQNLWKASALSTILPMGTLLLLPLLIPDASQSDKLLDDDTKDATSGSLLRRWLGY